MGMQEKSGLWGVGTYVCGVMIMPIDVITAFSPARSKRLGVCGD